MGEVEFAKARLKIAKRDVDSPGQMSRLILIGWSHVEDRNQAVTRPINKLGSCNGLHIVPFMEISLQDPVDFGEVAFADLEQRLHQPKDAFIGEPVEDELAVTARRGQPGTFQLLQMLRSVGDRKANPLRQRLDATFALTQMFKHFQPVGMTERPGDGREFREQGLFWTA